MLFRSPSLDYIERAYDEAKYGQFSTNPYIDIIIPSMIDRDMAPPGHHVMSCFVQYAPYDIDGGWDDANPDDETSAAAFVIEWSKDRSASPVAVAPGTAGDWAGLRASALNLLREGSFTSFDLRFGDTSTGNRYSLGAGGRYPLIWGARIGPQFVVEFREKPQTAEAREGMKADPALLERAGVGPDRPYLASMGRSEEHNV